MKNNRCMVLTYGDPAGIGPEILLKAFLKKKFKFKPIVIGIKEYLPKNRVNLKQDVSFLYSNSDSPKKIILGSPSPFTGSHSYQCLKQAVDFLKNKENHVLVTGPVSKSAIRSAGFKFAGQTDEIAKMLKINPEHVIMMFASHDLRIALFTRHISLRQVPQKLTKQTLEKFLIRLVGYMKNTFSDFKNKNPNIAVLGLNPHAGEKGMFGFEEEKVIKPVIKKLQDKRLKIYGPFSPDAALAKAGQDYIKKRRQDYDVYVSFYHDQALPMFKAVAGKHGVNLTLGLPFLRVSVDHGTAFDIAGKNKADYSGLISVIKFVEKLY